MYDYVTREFDLTPEEQEKARAIGVLEQSIQDGRRKMVLLESDGIFNTTKVAALRAFRNDFFHEIVDRLGNPDQLRGAWYISDDCTKAIVCQVKWVGDTDSK